MHISPAFRDAFIAPIPTSLALEAPAQNLRRGDRGPAVEQLQRALVKLGHLSAQAMSSGVGLYGPATEAAVKRFQQQARIGADGAYGPKTRAALQKALAPPPPPPAVTAPTANLRRGDKGAQVEQLQRALVKLGHLPASSLKTGPGIFGPATENGLKSFQRQWRLEADGAYGPDTRRALQRALAGDAPPTGPIEVKKPPVVFRPSPNHDDRQGTDIDTIVLHHTGSNDARRDLNTLTNPRTKVSAHYLVDRNGTVYQLVSDGRRAWHAGRSALHGVPTDVNARSIGIEIVNDGSGRTSYTEAQYRALEQLVPWLAKTYQVPLKNLVGHKDVAIPPGRKQDPSSNFDFARIRRATDRVV